MTSIAKELYEKSIDHVRRGQVRQALTALLDSLAIDPTYADSLESASRICHTLGSPEDAQLFEAVVRRPEDTEALFNLAYHLISQERPDVGVALLERCLQAGMEGPAVRQELAFARFQMGDFKDCREILEPLLTDPELADTEQLDVLFIVAEAAMYDGDRDACLKALEAAEKHIPTDEQRAQLDGLHHLIGRSMHWSQLDDLDLRQWHFIQHAGVILKVAGGLVEDGSRQGRYDVLHLKVDMVAFLIQRLLHLLQTLDVPIGAIASASKTAEPLARAIAMAGSLSYVEALDDHAGAPILLVAGNAAELGPIAPRLSAHNDDLRLFCVHLDWTRDEVVCPEIVGVLSPRAMLPWETRFSLEAETGSSQQIPADERPAEVIASEVVAAMAELPDDEGQARQAFEGIYLPLAQEILLGNHARHPYRRRFTAVSPCHATEE